MSTSRAKHKKKSRDNDFALIVTAINKLIKQRKYIKALNELECLIEKIDNFFFGHVILQQEQINSIYDCLNAIKVPQKTPHICVLRARLMAKTADKDGAYALCIETESKHPKHLDTYSYHALLLQNDKRFDEAEVILNKMLEISKTIGKDRYIEQAEMAVKKNVELNESSKPAEAKVEEEKEVVAEQVAQTEQPESEQKEIDIFLKVEEVAPLPTLVKLSYEELLEKLGFNRDEEKVSQILPQPRKVQPLPMSKLNISSSLFTCSPQEYFANLGKGRPVYASGAQVVIGTSLKK